MSPPPAHVAVDTLTTRGDELVIGDTGVRELAERAGSTPFFAYDRAAIDRRVTWLRDRMPSKTALYFAVQANPMPALVDLLAARTDGLDVASAGELRIALDSGTRPESISFAAPGKRDAELRMAIAAGITLNAESPAEIERITAIGDRLGLCPRVAVRVNPVLVKP